LIEESIPTSNAIKKEDLQLKAELFLQKSNYSIFDGMARILGTPKVLKCYFNF
jgi:hypothetical protein